MNYLDDDDDDEKLLGITKVELEIIVSSSVEKLLLKYGFIDKDKVIELKYITMNEICTEFGITRQTIYNWRKGNDTKQFIEPFIKKKGKNLLFEIEGLKKSVVSNRILLKSTKGYHLQRAVTPIPKASNPDQDFTDFEDDFN